MMRALVAGEGRLELCDRPRPIPPGECLIRVRQAGICGTDLEILAGYADFRGVPGHEFVGTVEWAPEGAEAWLGRRVVGEINIGCGTCAFCRKGVREHCERRRVLGIRGRDGAFAEYLALPPDNLHAVPDDLPDECAVFVEPAAAACRVLEQVDVSGVSEAAVIGDGRLGLLVAQVVHHAGVRVTVVGRHMAKLAIARQLGMETMAADGVRVARGRFELVVDASGRPDGLASALALVRPRGTIVLKSTFHGAASIATSPVVVDEVTIVGSRCGPFPKAIELLSRRALDVRPLLSGTYPLSEWQTAFATARSALKVVIEMTS
jgi:threonine dehydrogenase-like Zn-dependent dehydrogenase